MRSAALILVCALASAGADLRVGPGQPFATIQAAIIEARAGDVVQVESGVYKGNLVLDKTVHLVGAGAPLIRGTGFGSVVTIRAPRCTVQGFRIEHSGGSLMGNVAAGRVSIDVGAFCKGSIDMRRPDPKAHLENGKTDNLYKVHESEDSPVLVS